METLPLSVFAALTWKKNVCSWFPKKSLYIMWTYIFVFSYQYVLSQANCSMTNKNLSLHRLILKHNQFSYLIQENKHLLM